MLAYGKNMPRNNQFSVFLPRKNIILPRKTICPNFWKIYSKNTNLPSHRVQPLINFPCNASFTLTATGSGTDLESDSQLDGYFGLYRTFHIAQTRTQIPTSYLCTGHESESQSEPESVSEYILYTWGRVWVHHLSSVGSHHQCLFQEWLTKFFIVCWHVNCLLICKWTVGKKATTNYHFGVGPELKLRWWTQTLPQLF